MAQATSYRGLVYLAGVIPLDPPVMTVVPGDITAQVRSRARFRPAAGSASQSSLGIAGPEGSESLVLPASLHVICKLVTQGVQAAVRVAAVYTVNIAKIWVPLLCPWILRLRFLRYGSSRYLAFRHAYTKPVYPPRRRGHPVWVSRIARRRSCGP